MWEIPVHDISPMTEIVSKVILNNLIENVVPTNLSKDLKSPLCSIWQCQMTFSRISLENQKIHHFDNTKFPIVGKPLHSTSKLQNSYYNFSFPKIFSNMTFRNWIFRQVVDETLKKKTLESHFPFRSHISRKTNLFWNFTTPLIPY